MAFLTNLKNAMDSSPCAKSTLLVVTSDEAGGLYDHIPAPTSAEPNGASIKDGWALGQRLHTTAIGYFAKMHGVYHGRMEHASIIKFIEWNFLSGRTWGQLQTRDSDPAVNGIGGLLDLSRTGVKVP